jgi:hypothetical protein
MAESWIRRVREYKYGVGKYQYGNVACAPDLKLIGGPSGIGHPFTLFFLKLEGPRRIHHGLTIYPPEKICYPLFYVIRSNTPFDFVFVRYYYNFVIIIYLPEYTTCQKTENFALWLRWPMLWLFWRKMHNFSFLIKWCVLANISQTCNGT